MKNSLKLSLIAGLLVAAGIAYSGQRGGPWNDACDPMMGPGGMGMMQQDMRGDRAGRMDPEKRQERMKQAMEKRHELMKAQLKITPEQEGAWTAYVNAMKPKAARQDAAWQRPDPKEMAKLTTPERLEKIKAMRTERMKAMTTAAEEHDQATRALYSALSADQQKVFDALALPGQGAGRMGNKGPGQGPGQAGAARS